MEGGGGVQFFCSVHSLFLSQPCTAGKSSQMILQCENSNLGFVGQVKKKKKALYNLAKLCRKVIVDFFKLSIYLCHLSCDHKNNFQWAQVSFVTMALKRKEKGGSRIFSI